jgi:hypothetical protein
MKQRDEMWEKLLDWHENNAIDPKMTKTWFVMLLMNFENAIEAKVKSNEPSNFS